MRNYLHLMLIGCFFCGFSPVKAQVAQALSVKTALTGAFHPKYKMALEWQVRPNFSLEMTAGYQRFNPLRNDAFNGVRINEYARRETYEYQRSTGFKFNSSGWNYYGNGRPLNNPQPVSVTPLSLIRLSLGGRMYLNLYREALLLFIQPTVTTALFQTYEIEAARTVMVNDVYENWFDEFESPIPQMVRHTSYFKDIQHIERKKYWYVGPAVMLGASVRFPKGFLLEARYQLEMNLGVGLPSNAPTVEQLSYWHHQFDFMLGYRIPFHRKVAKVPISLTEVPES